MEYYGQALSYMIILLCSGTVTSQAHNGTVYYDVWVHLFSWPH